MIGGEVFDHADSGQSRGSAAKASVMFASTQSGVTVHVVWRVISRGDHGA